MKTIWQTAKFLATFSFISCYMVHAAILWLLTKDSWALRRKLTETVATYSRIGLKIFNIQVTVHGEYRASIGALLVGNHLSYLDVLVLASFCPSAFVTSKEIETAPFLGTICRLAGCVFVDRKNRFNLLEEVRDISDALERNVNVMVFPEATSTNGEQLLRFRRPLFAAAQAAQKEVVPFCINYRTVNGVPMTRANRDSVCWYGDMDFLPHLWHLNGLKSVTVDLHFLKSFFVPKDEDVTVTAARAHQQVQSVFKPFR